jgi:cytochrome c oxidase assembly factor CtaG/putative copper export protein
MSTKAHSVQETPHTRPSAERLRRGWTVSGRVATAVVVAAGVAAALAAIVPSRAAIPGIPDAGWGVSVSLPVLRTMFQLSAAATLGWLIAAAIWIPAQPSGLVSVGGYRALRAASLAAWMWTATALLLIPVSISDLLGRPLSRRTFTASAIIRTISIFPNLTALCLAAAAAAAVAVAARTVLRSRHALWLVILTGLGLIPQAFTGHAGDSAGHDVAVDLMTYHLLGAAVWVGGLVAVLGLARQQVPELAVILRRYSACALVAFLVVALSGAGSVLLRIDSASALWESGYGRLVLAKFTLLLILGWLGHRHRVRSLPQLNAGNRGPLIRWATVELAVMGAVIGVAAALGRTALPAPDSIPGQTGADLVLGFQLPGPPTLWRLVSAWRFDLVLGTAALVAVALYLRSVRILRRRGVPWPARRTAAWLIGCLMIVLATSSGLDRYAQAQFSLHMIAHMMIGMLSPILLVMGGPVTLAVRTLRPAGRSGSPGLRELILTITRSRATRLLTHPLVAIPLFTGSFYVIYFTGLFQILISSHTGHLVMNVHLLLVGYLYYWTVIGVDPSPRRLPPIAKLGLLLVPLPFHAVFGLSLMNTRTVLAADYYQRLSLPWVQDLLADQRLGGAIAWALADIPTAIVIVALMSQWYRSDEREARRSDRRGAGRDQELDAYNAMLTDLAERDRK